VPIYVAKNVRVERIQSTLLAIVGPARISTNSSASAIELAVIGTPAPAVALS
jgi:hypothetical protein